MACSWQDTEKVNMLAATGNCGITEVQVQSKSGVRIVSKPSVQVSYNKYMGGLIRFD